MGTRPAPISSGFAIATGVYRIGQYVPVPQTD